MALQDWFETAEYGQSAGTVENYRVLANHPRAFCEREGIGTLGGLDGRASSQCEIRRQQGVARTTAARNVTCLRVFVAYC